MSPVSFDTSWGLSAGLALGDFNLGEYNEKTVFVRSFIRSPVGL